MLTKLTFELKNLHNISPELMLDLSGELTYVEWLIEYKNESKVIDWLYGLYSCIDLELLDFKYKIALSVNTQEELLSINTDILSIVKRIQLNNTLTDKEEIINYILTSGVGEISIKSSNQNDRIITELNSYGIKKSIFSYSPPHPWPAQRNIKVNHKNNSYNDIIGNEEWLNFDYNQIKMNRVITENEELKTEEALDFNKVYSIIDNYSSVLRNR